MKLRSVHFAAHHPREPTTMRAFIFVLCLVGSAAIKDTAADGASKKFLEKYATEEGVVVKESGLMSDRRRFFFLLTRFHRGM